MNFSEKTFDFLVENRLQNSREFFHAHHDEYERFVLEPMRELVESLGPEMLRIDPLFITEPKIGRCISRVNRDTRFSADKSLYRENIWFVFARKKQLYDGYPCFYADFGPDGCAYGCGYYKASSDTVAAIRNLIVSDNKMFEAADKALLSCPDVALYGEKYKKSRFPDCSERQKEWLDRKNYGVGGFLDDFDLIFSDGLKQFLAERFSQLAPVYILFAKAEELRIAEG
ncbi:MAG: DUF2461 domain-containing protein [Clostridia bacterium]|nr:DUF2461 domain-containing protein [Clostridia bacterium]